MEDDDEPDFIEYRICGRRSEDNSDVWHGPWKALPAGRTEVPTSVKLRAKSYLRNFPVQGLRAHKAVWIEKREVRYAGLPYEEMKL